MATLGVSAPSQLILAAMSPRGVGAYNPILQPSLQGTFLTPSSTCTPYSLCSPHRVITLAFDGHYIRVTPLLLVFTVSRVTPFALDVHCITVTPLMLTVSGPIHSLWGLTPSGSVKRTDHPASS